jgi:hypothetical protein
VYFMIYTPIRVLLADGTVDFGDRTWPGASVRWWSYTEGGL